MNNRTASVLLSSLLAIAFLFSFPVAKADDKSSTCSSPEMASAFHQIDAEKDALQIELGSLKDILKLEPKYKADDAKLKQAFNGYFYSLKTQLWNKRDAPEYKGTDGFPSSCQKEMFTKNELADCARNLMRQERLKQAAGKSLYQFGAFGQLAQLFSSKIAAKDKESKPELQFQATLGKMILEDQVERWNIAHQFLTESCKILVVAKNSN